MVLVVNDTWLGLVIKQVRLRLQLNFCQLSRNIFEMATRKSLTRIISPPVELLPVELLLEIFSLSLSGKWGPLLLGAVCRKWRDVVCNEPHFWDTINLAISRSTRVTQLGVLQQWLTCSGERPLSIVLFLAGTTHYQEVTDPFLQLLMEESHRWERIEFDLPFNCFSRSFQKLGNLPVLRSITIHHYYHHDLIYFFQAPLLRELIIHDWMDIPTRLQSILSLDLSHSLKLLPSLAQLHLHASEKDLGLFGVFLDVLETYGILPNLRVLSYTGPTDSSFTNVGLAASQRKLDLPNSTGIKRVNIRSTSVVEDLPKEIIKILTLLAVMGMKVTIESGLSFLIFQL